MEQLEKYFDTAFGAPDGLIKLRELIITLAMQGKLTSQYPNDGRATDLLDEIAKEKKSKIQIGEFRNDENETEYASNISFENISLPPNWKWATISNIGFVQGGKRLPKGHDYSQSPTNHRYLTVTNMKNGSIIDNDIKYISEKTFQEISRYTISKKNIYITIAGTIGSVGIIPDEYDGMNLTENASKLTFYKFNKSFLVYLLNSSLVQKQFKELTNKMAQPKLSLRSILSTLIPVPPLKEQSRIVDKINELMSRCDELEKLHAERGQKRLAVHTAAIRKMLDAPEQATFDDAWQFITRHFGDLYTVRENVAELRKAILQLAVMGKLVKQDPKEGTGRELLEEIERERRKMVKEGKIKEPKPLPPIKPEEIPYEVPEGWEWVRFGNLIELISGQHLTPNEYNEKKMGYSYYTGPADFQELNPKPSRWTKIYRSIALYGDILITVKGAGVGKTNLLNEDKAAISRQLMAIRVMCINRDYAHIFLKSIFYELQSMATGIAIPGIGRENILQKPFPLPPLSEQNRIVQKTNNLMNFCDTLEQKIKTLIIKKKEVLEAIMGINVA